MEKFEKKEKLASAKLNKLVDELNANTENIEKLNKTLFDEEVGDIPKLEKGLEKAQEDIEEVKLFKYPNATIKGDLNINHGQISGFSNENYLILPFIFDVTGKAFELNLAFTTGDDVTLPQNVIGSKFCLAAYIQNGKLTTRISTSGTNWEISKESSLAVTPNTTYYIKLSYDRLQYKLQYSLDGKSYTQDWVEVNPNTPKEGLVYIGVGNNFNNPFGGIINLNKCEILINNQHYWEGMDDVGLATRLATDMSNIDEEGEQRIKEIVHPELSELSLKVDGLETDKQDTISDLEVIRSGAALGATAIQEHQSLKTINNQSIVGSGNINIEGGGGDGIKTINGSAPDANGNIDVAVMTPEQEEKVEKSIGIADLVGLLASGSEYYKAKLSDGSFFISKSVPPKSDTVEIYSTSNPAPTSLRQGMQSYTKLKHLHTEGWDLRNCTSIFQAFINSFDNADYINLDFVNGQEVSFTQAFQNAKVKKIRIRNCKPTSMFLAFSTQYTLEEIDMEGVDMSSAVLDGAYELFVTYQQFPSITTIKWGYDCKMNVYVGSLPNLTIESARSIIDGLYDFAGKGEDIPEGRYGVVTFSSKIKSLLTDEEKAKITAKGWTLA